MHRYIIATLIIAVTIAVIGTAMANVMPATADEDKPKVHCFEKKKNKKCGMINNKHVTVQLNFYTRIQR